MIAAQTDKENLAGVLKNFPTQILEASKLAAKINLNNIQNIVVCGMGGSGLPGDIARNLSNINVPFLTLKDYTLPAFIGKNSLVFIISYSGNTEETIAAYNEAKKRNAQIVIITSGGELAAKAKQDNLPLILVPSGLQPRMAFGYQTIPILTILENAGLTTAINWKVVASSLIAQSEHITSHAKEIVTFLKNKIPMIYASVAFSSAAYKWKIDFNENTKIHAFCNAFAEFNHNEINGYVNLNGNYAVIILRDQNDHPRIKKRMGIIADIIKKKNIPALTIDTQGSDLPTRLLSIIWLGDWVSYYMALDINTDPTPVKIIEDLKAQLK